MLPTRLKRPSVPSLVGTIDVGRLVILTGERRVGKSTVCAELTVLAREAGLRCGGILTLANDGERDVVDAQTRERRRLTRPPGAGAVMW